ncbi:trehalase-like [Leptidea sinapis]|uniref:trehalase-like n=1 Tax=Leptidea sinapis TaxID=189913 RepID=UPI0021C36345|nr:trehalase-like [Leptidea sinapis]
MMLVLCSLIVAASATDLPPSCIKPVYCDSKLLHHVQTNKIFNDSKIFVDLQMFTEENTTLSDFQKLLDDSNNDPSKEQIQDFVKNYFTQTSELDKWTPTDYSANPPVLDRIKDENLKEFARKINDIWPVLGRKVKRDVFENPDRYSFIPVSHGFIIPGGRFTELYYWDTYWIIEGLLVCGMQDTVKGVIQNLIELLVKLGHIPNGSRWYYQERSQPPLLSAMMALYIRETNDIEFLEENIDALESELEYWLDTQMITFDKGDRTYSLLRYYAPSQGPRPESYVEDYNGAQRFNTEERQSQFYIDVKSAAESGWDFSTRWFISEDGSNKGNLSDIHSTDIVPVDLNAIFAAALQNMANFQALVQNSHKVRASLHWAYLAKQWRDTIRDVFWNEDEGIWLDWNLAQGAHRKYFYPSNAAPLWTGAVDKTFIKVKGPKILQYLKQSHGLDFPGGVPTSLERSGEQWDYPNAWPPLVSLIVNALEALELNEAKDLAFQVAQNWVRSCHKGFSETKQLFEKYDVESPGKIGGGGEYVVQTGFGWSNGVVLEFLEKYGSKISASDDGGLKSNELLVAASSPNSNNLAVLADNSEAASNESKSEPESRETAKDK